MKDDYLFNKLTEIEIEEIEQEMKILKNSLIRDKIIIFLLITMGIAGLVFLLIFQK